jgi:copper resistance protein C
MPRRRAAPAALLLTVAMLLLLPGAAAAHSELVTSDPADGATVTVSPAQITGDFSEAVDVGRSTMELRGPDGSQIAVGKVPDGGDPTRIVIADVPPLAPGAYEVRWTTVTPDDEGLERGTFTFTVAAAASSGSPAAAASPGASPPPESTAGGGAGDLLIPILVLAAVLVGGAALFLRRRR